MARNGVRGWWPVFGVAALAACGDSAAPIPADPPAQYVAVRRAWAAGERDATIARWTADRPFVLPMGGDATDQMIAALHPDSTTEIILNPLWSPSPSLLQPALPPLASLRFFPPGGAGWDVMGIDLGTISALSSPRDTTHWVGVFWSNQAEPTWKGFVVAAVPFGQTTVPITRVRTSNFDAGGGKSGAGGGESRLTTGQYWEANDNANVPNNSITITAAFYGTATTVTTGPFLGGTEATGTMFGRLRTISMALAAGAGTPASVTVDFDFSAAAIMSVRRVCEFPTPCTTNVPFPPPAPPVAVLAGRR